MVTSYYNGYTVYPLLLFISLVYLFFSLRTSLSQYSFNVLFTCSSNVALSLSNICLSKTLWCHIIRDVLDECMIAISCV